MASLPLCPLRLAVVALLAIIVQAAAKTSIASTELVDLRLQSSTDHADRVTFHLEMGGHLQPRRNDSPSPDSSPALENIPLRATAELLYDEQRLVIPEAASPQTDPPEADASPAPPTLAARYYHQADAQITAGTEISELTLRDQRRLVRVAATTSDLAAATWATATDYPVQAIHGPFTQEELDLLETSVAPPVVDRLLPTEPVAIGASWSHAADAIVPLLRLESATVCEVASILTEANPRFARCEIAGTVHGQVDGGALEQELRGIYLVDRQRGRVTQLNLAIRETRQASPIQPPFTGVVKVRLKIDPLPPNDHRDHNDLSNLAPRDNGLSAARRQQVLALPPATQPVVQTHSEKLGFETEHAPGWQTVGRWGEQLTLRRLNDGQLLAHANLTRLPAKRLDPQQALDTFRTDVVQSLGDSLQGVRSESQWTNQHGCRVMQVVTEGRIDNVDIEWHSYQVAPPEGAAIAHRLALSFTMEKDRVPQLNGEDRQLVDRLKLLPETARLPETETPAPQSAQRLDDTKK